MRAVNLIPADSGRGRGAGAGPRVPAFAILGVLAVAVAFVTMYVLASNTISERQATVANLQAQAARANAQAAGLNKYIQFEQLAQTRSATVREIASTRFDWHTALADLSKVVPANTSLQSLTGTVAPGVSVTGGTSSGAGGGASGGVSALRADIAAPAFELTGCSRTQDDVARLMSRLRLINGVTRVTLGDSQKPGGNAAGASSGSSSGASGGCGPNAPIFDLVVFFKPLPGASAQGASPAASQTGTTTPRTTTTGTATTSTGTSR
jgi:Tfp pilus assembly protein PilN